MKSSPVEEARAAFARLAWGDAFAAYTAEAGRASLEAPDQERLAISAYLVGADDECAQAWQAAYRRALESGDAGGAARHAVWLGLCLMLQGQMAQSGGWLTRAERLVEERGLDCAASGYLLLPPLLASLDTGNPAGALDLAVRATRVGDRFGDSDLCALGILGQGQALIAMGEPARGTSHLDEVMVAVTGGEVGPIVSGIVYCAVILECMRLFDLERAWEWTAALSSWCEAQPDLVPYRGQCLVHRSQLQQAAGAWRDATTTAEAACRRLTEPPHPALGLAEYQVAELYRLVGAFPAAEAAYGRASRHGCPTMPGLALLDLARGQIGSAGTGIRRALQETIRPLERPALLSAAVEILVAGGDLPTARSAAEELSALAAASSSDVLGAMASHATGALLLEGGDPASALDELRAAAPRWRLLRMPYEAARTAFLVGLACAALGDRTSAALEMANAREVFVELGAAPDLDRSDALAGSPAEVPAPRGEAAGAQALSPREREVLAHVATGKTNRAIATELVISEHTVGRHLENIFVKLGVGSRAAATAYAYEHDLL